MDKEICKLIVEQRKEFIPHLFTDRQVVLIERYLQQKELTPSEKTYLYSTITKKIEALRLLKKEYYITGKEMIPQRVESARKILDGFSNEKAFISGSYLYNKDSQDIDIFIVGKRHKQEHRNNQHLTYITEADTQKPLFVSVLNYCIANFSFTVMPIIKREQYGELLFIYQLAVNEILDNDDQKTVRRLIFEYYVQTKKIILDSFSLHQHFYEIKIKPTAEKIELINLMFKEMLLTLYSKKYLYSKLVPFIKNIQEMATEYKANANLLIYIDLLNEVKNEC